MNSDEEKEEKQIKAARDFVVAGLDDLRVMHDPRIPIESAVIILSGERDSDLEDIGRVLGEIRKARVVNMSRTPVRSLEIFSVEYFDIRVLDLSDTRVSQDQVELLSNVTTLRDLQLGSNPLVTDVSFVATLAKLETLGISFTGVEDISVLIKLRRLQFLSVAGNRFRDKRQTVDIISEMYTLRELDISFTEVDLGCFDTSVLARLFRLTYTGKSGECKFYYSNSQAVVGRKFARFVEHHDRREMPSTIHVEVRKKTKRHPLYGMGSDSAFYVPEGGIQNFGYEITLFQGKTYTFIVSGDGSGAHPFYLSYKAGGGSKNYTEYAIFPDDGQGLANGEFEFMPLQSDPDYIYGECMNHRHMGFPIRVKPPRLYFGQHMDK